ncbi:hypothetical protein CYMTET_56049 [Cymbomonas tetramitiformis]|uniref:SMP-LTD domain-containing protein n=1 Tax=Cymbomonas tetramitiformis TaxID=36881 RepID=A0AAE0BBQ1_9CHLO|nr:hypothetical protein CYMTET_56049 [Cymbomonas tetramitiformis]
MGLLKILFSLIYFILGALGGAFSWLTWGAALANLIATYRKDYQKRRDNLIAANTEALRKDPKLLRECLGNLPAALLHPEFETAEWLNQAFSKLWTNLDEAISLKVKSIIEYHLPSWLGIEEFTFGKKPFVIKGVKYVPVDKGQARDSGQPEQDRAVVLDLEVEWQSDCSVVLNMNFLGQSAARLQDVEVSVPLRIELKPLVTTLPCFSSLQMFFLKEPHIDYTFVPIGVRVKDIPWLDAHIRDLVKGILNSQFISPNRLIIPIAEECTRGPSGVLHVVVERVSNFQDAAVEITFSIKGTKQKESTGVITEMTEEIFEEIVQTSWWGSKAAKIDAQGSTQGGRIPKIEGACSPAFKPGQGSSRKVQTAPDSAMKRSAAQKWRQVLESAQSMNAHTAEEVAKQASMPATDGNFLGCPERVEQTLVRRHTQMWNNEFVFLVDNKRTAALKMCIESSPDDIMYSYRRRIAEEDFELFELDLRGAPKVWQEGGGELVKGEVVMRCTYYDITSGSDSLSKRVMVDSGTLPVMIVAGTSSRVGTTSLAVGLMAALHKKGLIVQPCKVGGDMDSHQQHYHATGRYTMNIDTNVLSKAQALQCYALHTQGADVVVIEGASGGLHDGRFMDGGRGSTAEVASWLQAPVLLVVEAVVAGRGAAAAPKWGSAVAAVKGNAELDSAVQILGTVANRVPAASPGSDVDVAAGLRVGLMTSKCDIAVFGALPQDSNVARAFPTDEIPQAAGCLAKHVQTLGQLTFQYIDIDELLKTARTMAPTAPLLRGIQDGGVVEFPQQQTAQGLVDAKTLTGVEGDPVRVAVAWDDAFSRYYHSNLALLEARGIHLEYFSPLAGERLPHGVSGLYLGSGHVERHAAQLSAHRSLRDAVQELLRAGGVVYAEGSGLAFCGTLFQQGREGAQHRGLEVLPFAARLHPSGDTEGEVCSVKPQKGCAVFKKQRCSGRRPAALVEGLRPAATMAPWQEFRNGRLRRSRAASRCGVFEVQGQHASSELELEGYCHVGSSGGIVLGSNILMNWGTNVGFATAAGTAFREAAIRVQRAEKHAPSTRRRHVECAVSNDPERPRGHVADSSATRRVDGEATPHITRQRSGSKPVDITPVSAPAAKPEVVMVMHIVRGSGLIQKSLLEQQLLSLRSYVQVQWHGASYKSQVLSGREPSWDAEFRLLVPRACWHDTTVLLKFKVIEEASSTTAEMFRQLSEGADGTIGSWDVSMSELLEEFDMYSRGEPRMKECNLGDGHGSLHIQFILHSIETYSDEPLLDSETKNAPVAT